MEFHNIFGCAHGESKLRDNSTRAHVQTSRQRHFGKTRNETTKNRTQHDQGSLNKQSAFSINYLASALAIYHRSQQGIIFLTSCKKNIQVLSQEIAWSSRTLGIQLLLQRFKFLNNLCVRLCLLYTSPSPRD